VHQFLHASSPPLATSATVRVAPGSPHKAAAAHAEKHRAPCSQRSDIPRRGGVLGAAVPGATMILTADLRIDFVAAEFGEVSPGAQWWRARFLRRVLGTQTVTNAPLISSVDLHC
jgi:hypothetical protein